MITKQTRRSVAAALISAMALLGAVALAAPPASAMPAGNEPLAVQPGELVVNGNAESGTTGWSSGLQTHPHGSGGYPAAVIVNSSGATGATFSGGAHLFSGSGASSTSSQTIDLTPSATAIASGAVTADLSVYIGGYASQNDRATVTYTFQDGTGAALGSPIVYGPVTNTQRGNASGFIHFGQSVAVPTGARSVLITIATTRQIAPANDGYVDNVSLQLSAPAPTAANDTPSTPAGTPFTFDPTTNDIAVAPATIDPTTVRLLDNGAPVTSLTTADGTYLVNTTTGQVTFTPTPGFTGTASPVSYQVADTNGQPATATITVTVAPVVGTPLIDPLVGGGIAVLVVLLAGGLFLSRRRHAAEA